MNIFMFFSCGLKSSFHKIIDFVLALDIVLWWWCCLVFNFFIPLAELKCFFRTKHCVIFIGFEKAKPSYWRFGW